MLSPSLPGLTFADPEVHTKLAAAVKINGDATELPFSAVLEHSNEHPECVAECSMPRNEGVGKYDPWMDYVGSLLEPNRFPRLSRMFSDAKPASGSVVAEVQRLAGLRDAGAITSEQFDEILKSLLD